MAGLGDQLSNAVAQDPWQAMRRSDNIEDRRDEGIPWKAWLTYALTGSPVRLRDQLMPQQQPQPLPDPNSQLGRALGMDDLYRAMKGKETGPVATIGVRG
jgi:hypothetical protein